MKISTERLKQIINEELKEARDMEEEENEATLALGLLSKLRVEMGNQNEIGIVAGGTFQLLQDLLKSIERSLYYLRKNT